MSGCPYDPSSIEMKHLPLTERQRAVLARAERLSDRQVDREAIAGNLDQDEAGALALERRGELLPAAIRRYHPNSSWVAMLDRGDP